MMKLVVEVRAHFEWAEPAGSPESEMMRGYANNIVADVGKQLEPAVQLLVAEFLAVQGKLRKPELGNRHGG